MAHDHSAAPAAPPGFRLYWLAETLRLREAQWGPLQDSSETRRVRAQGGPFVQRLLARAHLLGQREGLDVLIRQWSGGAKLALVLMLGMAILAGAGAALGALGDGGHQVNLLLALVALLGLHLATFLFWCVSLVLPTGETQASLGELWLWITKKLARGPQAALVPRALVGLLSRQKALGPMLGGISHGLWLCALGAMLIVLLALLSARRYTFGWETTLLSPDTFVWLSSALGWLPSLLGFDVPPPDIVRISDGMHALPDSAHAQWSSWLIGNVVCYGLVPRSLALLGTGLLAWHRTQGLSLDPGLPGYAELRDRLDPYSQSGQIDAPAPDLFGPAVQHPQTGASVTNNRAIVGLELAEDLSWPPRPLMPQVSDLGIVDTREQRHRLLNALQNDALQKLLIVCDVRQTPDRGTVALISELTGLAQQTHVALLSAERAEFQPNGTMEEELTAPSSTDDSRAPIWQERLRLAGFDPAHMHMQLASALDWLGTADRENEPAGPAP